MKQQTGEETTIDRVLFGVTLADFMIVISHDSNLNYWRTGRGSHFRRWLVVSFPSVGDEKPMLDDSPLPHELHSSCWWFVYWRFLPLLSSTIYCVDSPFTAGRSMNMSSSWIYDIQLLFTPKKTWLQLGRRRHMLRSQELISQVDAPLKEVRNRSLEVAFLTTHGTFAVAYHHLLTNLGR